MLSCIVSLLHGNTLEWGFMMGGIDHIALVVKVARVMDGTYGGPVRWDAHDVCR